MEFRSTADLAATIAGNLNKVPRDVDLIVGIPRSGLLAANLLALDLNLPLTDLEGLLVGNIFQTGTTRMAKNWIKSVAQARHIMVVDDSVHSGRAIAVARRQVAAAKLRCKVTFAAVYAVPSARDLVDVYFEICKQPRMFGWNYMHHPDLSDCCVDIDGVLCCDPEEHENDDGEAYLRFLSQANPLHLPTQEIGWLVTSRLEKYRPHTEAWLREHGVRFRNLIMLDGYTAEERRQLGLHGRFKAEIYKNLPARLFIESDAAQASEIAALSGKPVLCVATQQLAKPRSTSPLAIQQNVRGRGLRLRRRVFSKLKSLAYRLDLIKQPRTR